MITDVELIFDLKFKYASGEESEVKVTFLDELSRALDRANRGQWPGEQGECLWGASRDLTDAEKVALTGWFHKNCLDEQGAPSASFAAEKGVGIDPYLENDKNYLVYVADGPLANTLKVAETIEDLAMEISTSIEVVEVDEDDVNDDGIRIISENIEEYLAKKGPGSTFTVTSVYDFRNAFEPKTITINV